MKSISRLSGSRPRRATRGNVSLAEKGRPLDAGNQGLTDALGWDGVDEDLDLEHLDLEHLDVEAIEDGIDDDAPMTDWVSDRDFALQIARGALH